MKNLLWIIIGVGVGFALAHQVNQTKQGKKFFSEVDARTKAFGDTVVAGYKEREAELHKVLRDS